MMTLPTEYDQPGVSPEPAAIRKARLAAGLSQAASARLIGSRAETKPQSTWQAWEYGISPMPPGLWDLFLLRTGQAQAVTTARLPGLENIDEPARDALAENNHY